MSFPIPDALLVLDDTAEKDQIDAAFEAERDQGMFLSASASMRRRSTSSYRS